MSAAKQAVVQVIYPKEARGDFNMTYYLESHMPLVQKLWGPFGLKSWTINVLQPEAGNHVQAYLVFESLQAWEAASASPAQKEIFGDIPKFTSTSPAAWVGEVEAHTVVSQ